MIYQYFENIEFANPLVLTGLLIIPFIVLWYIIKNKQQRAQLLVTTTKFLSSKKNYKTSLYHLPFIFRCLAIACLLIALARPQEKFTEGEYEGAGIDIMLCFDVSGSMINTNLKEEDFSPNRLEGAKRIATNFVRTRAGDRIGVVLFSEQAFALCPLTSDTGAVITQIKNISPYILNLGGTAIGNGIAACINRLRESKSKNKIILLLTDGVNSAGAVSPQVATDMGKLYGIKIYTIGIGIGTNVITSSGDIDQIEQSGFDEVLLKNIANETGGEYFHATDERDLRKGYDNIGKLEKSTIKTIYYNKVEDKYLLFLEVGFLFIFIELLLRYSIFRKFP